MNVETDTAEMHGSEREKAVERSGVDVEHPEDVDDPTDVDHPDGVEKVVTGGR